MTDGSYVSLIESLKSKKEEEASLFLQKSLRNKIFESFISIKTTEYN